MPIITSVVKPATLAEPHSLRRRRRAGAIKLYHRHGFGNAIGATVPSAAMNAFDAQQFLIDAAASIPR
jgi:hypothetical protein